MLTEPMTLYKLMNLYMLKQVNFPLTNAQLTNFFTEHEYTTYFTLQQALNELEDAGLVHKEASHNSTRYDITREGEETLNFFGKNISSAIIEDMDQYLKENKFRLREEVGTTADFYKGTNQDYIVHCEVRENKTTLIRLDLSVPDREQAEAMYLENKKPGNLCPRHAVTFILTCCAGMFHGVSSAGKRFH